MKQPERSGREDTEPRQVIRLRAETDPRLADILSDYMVGILDAAVEYVVDDEAEGLTIVHGFIGVEQYSEEVRVELEQRLHSYGAEVAGICRVPAPRVSSTWLQDQDWSQKWKEHFRPFEIVEGLMIVPSWEPHPMTGSKQVIIMDPGMAFGTGHHATTRLCLTLLRSLAAEIPGCRILDVGTGTGILAMAAVLFGAEQATGIDNDTEAVAAARDNCERNGLEDMITISGRDLADIEEEYEVVVANIVHDVLCTLADDLARVTGHRGFLALSGLLAGEQVASIRKEFADRGFISVEEATEGEWSAVLLRKSD